MSTSLIAITNVLNDARGIASIVRGNPKIVRRKRSSDNVEFDMTRSLAPDGKWPSLSSHLIHLTCTKPVDRHRAAWYATRAVCRH